MDTVSNMLGVRPPDNGQIAAVERRIMEKYNLQRGQKIIVGMANNPAGLRAELKSWLMEQGINPRKIERMQDSTLATAYESDKYLDKLRYDIKSGRLDHVGDPKFGWRLRGSLDLDNLDIDDDYVPPQRPPVPRDIFDEPSTIEPDNTIEEDKPQAPSSSPTQPMVSIADLAKAADQVISPRLSAIKAQLEREIESKIASTKLSLSDQAKADIKRLAIEDGAELIRSHIEHYNARITELAQLIDKHRLVEIKINDREPHKVDGITHKQFQLILQYIHTGNVYLRGPAGSGKTSVAEQTAKALNVPFYFTGAINSEYKLTGFIDAQGRVINTEFRKAYEHGGLFLFDEIDGSLPGAVLAFNAALANDWADFPDGKVRRHKDFYCIAAANTFGSGADRIYVGRNQLDGATLDRFYFVDFDYDEDMERVLACNDNWVTRVQQVRKAVNELKLRRVVSPRSSIQGAKALLNGVPQSEIEKATIFKGMDQDEITKIEAQINSRTTITSADELARQRQSYRF